MEHVHAGNISHEGKYFHAARATQVVIYCDELFAIRSKQRQHYIDALLIQYNARELTRTQCQLIRVLFAAAHFPRDSLPNSKRLSVRGFLRWDS